MISNYMKIPRPKLVRDMRKEHVIQQKPRSWLPGAHINQLCLFRPFQIDGVGKSLCGFAQISSVEGISPDIGPLDHPRGAIVALADFPQIIVHVSDDAVSSFSLCRTNNLPFLIGNLTVNCLFLFYHA